MNFKASTDSFVGEETKVMTSTSDTASPMTTSGKQTTTQQHNSMLTGNGLISLIVGALVLLVVIVFLGVWICRKKKCSEGRNAGSARLQPPSYETSRHGGNTGDYLNVVYDTSTTPNPNIPYPHNITSNNDNEYDYVS